MPTFPVLDGDATVACNRYNAIASRLVSASFPDSSRHIENLASIRNEIDVYVLDGYGVLNIGPDAIPGAVQRVHQLQDSGATVLVLTNGASLPAEQTLQKYLSLGLPLTAEQIVSSRDGLIVRLQSASPQSRWGVMAPNYAQAEFDGFILLSSDEWSARQQQLLIDAIKQNPRPVLVGNPDLVAPFADLFSLEPGWFAHDLFDHTAHTPEFFGKPFGNVFDLIKQKIGAVDPTRVAMVGDTLHTDILGGAAAGFKTVLISGHGLLRGQDVKQTIAQAGIRPDFIAPDP